MNDVPPFPRRSLQARLALFYAAIIYGAGIVVVAVVTLPLAGLQSAVPVPSVTPGSITGTGNGIGPHQVLIGSVVALALLIPIALSLGWFVAGRFLRPLRAITATAEAISAGNLHQRLDLGEPADELTELGAILDDLFARLQSSFDAQRHFVTNVSHELRTPLAGQRTLLEVALADPDADAVTLRAAAQEALVLGEQQERLIRALLGLASSERGLTGRETIDLAGVARAVLGARRAPAERAGILVTQDLAPAVVTGDPGLIESLIANLADNAVRHNHPGGYVQVTTGMTAGGATLVVTNSGPLILAGQIEHLFQPFQTLAPARHSGRDGYGLGLAIVRAVAQAHHALVTTTPGADGGLAITVRFTVGSA